jgi:hypothetical protein
MKKGEVTECQIYCLLNEVTELLEKKTLRKNKNFLDLCNSILCLCSSSDDEGSQNLRHRIHTTLKEEGLYEGL